MGLCIGDGWISCHVQPAIAQALGKDLGVFNHFFLIRILKMVHFVRRHEQPEQGSEMVVADAARKCPPFHSLPKGIPDVFGLVIGSSDSSLGSEKCFMCGAGNDISPFLKRLLKMRSDQPQHMGHVVHDKTIQAGLLNHGANFSHRFTMQRHAFSQNDKFGLLFEYDLSAGINVDLVLIFRYHREVDHRRFICF